MNFRNQPASGRFQPFTLRKIRQNKRRGRLDVGPADVSRCLSSRTGTTSFQPFVPGEHRVASRRGKSDSPRQGSTATPGGDSSTPAEVSRLIHVILRPGPSSSDESQCFVFGRQDVLSLCGRETTDRQILTACKLRQLEH